MKVQLGDLATWVAAFGTVAAVSVALWQVGVERKARRKQETADRVQQRRAQAELISAWVAKEEGGGKTAWIAILNSSQEPVYEVIASIAPIQGAGDRTGKGTQPHFRGFLSVVPPGRYYVRVDGGYRGMSFQPGVAVAFTDKAGVPWNRDALGLLGEISERPPEFLGLSRPLSRLLPDIETLEVQS